ncbi:MAG: SAP domain-containing protein, partial [Poseidonia sp.]
MGEEPTTTLTVAKLKALCVLNDVSASGKKAELLARLLEAGVDKETLGIEVYDESTATFQPTAAEETSTQEPDGEETAPDNEAASGAEVEVDEEPTEAVDADEPVMLSLEDDDTQSVPLPDAEVSEDEVLEAEILEADLIEDVEISVEDEAETVPLPAATSSSTPLPKSSTETSPLTLMEMVRRPQAIAVMLTLVLLGAGGWYYVNNQLEPFTADSLRYGDRMGYVITEGSFLASEEYVELVTNQLDDPPNYCKIRLSFQGESTASVTEGTGVELNTQSSDDRLGAVSIRGGQGLSWLAVESVNDMSFSQFNIFGHKK